MNFAALLPLLKFQMIASAFRGGRLNINKIMNMVMQLQLFNMLPKMLGGAI